MPKVLFLLHGMGVHGADWAKPIREKLVAAAGSYRDFQNGPPLDQRVEMVPVTYDDVFTEILKQWQDSTDALASFAREHAMAIPSVLGWLNTAPDVDKQFFWSHVVDVLLYRFNSMATKQVRLRVMRAIAAKLTAAMQDRDIIEASVLAHSLGTAVAHDSLAILGSVPLDGSRAFVAGNFRFLNLVRNLNPSGRGRFTFTEPASPSLILPSAARYRGRAPGRS